MKKLILEWIRIIIGLFVFAFGVHLTIFANIGLAPWDCLGMGISYHTPLNYGLSMTLIALTVLGIDVLLKEKIGFGTIIDALLTGNFVQFFNSILLIIAFTHSSHISFESNTRCTHSFNSI